MSRAAEEMPTDSPEKYRRKETSFQQKPDQSLVRVKRMLRMLEGRTVVQNHQEFRCEYCALTNLPAPLHYGTKPGHFETSKIHFPSTYVSILVCSRPQCAGLAGLAHSAALV